MRKLMEIYKTSSWYPVFNFSGTAAKSRSYLLFATASQAIVSGLTTGIFYSGFLGSFQIDIVSISILTLIPYATSLFSLLTPLLLEKLKQRRKLLSISRLAYYLINILGLTFMPLFLKSSQGRMLGLVIIVFLANAINALFTSGYSAWHMGYIEPEIRSGYITAISLFSAGISGIFLLGMGALVDTVPAASQQRLLIFLRCLGFLIALLDIYFLQKPPEPVYKSSQRERIKFSDVLRIPLKNKGFLKIISIYFLQTLFSCILTSIVSTWLLETIRVSYSYVNLVSLSYVFFILPTSVIWRKEIARRGVLKTLALTDLLMAPSYFLHAFMTAENYFWIMLIVKLIQHSVQLGGGICVSSLIYIALPQQDQTCYLSFQNIAGNLASLLGMGLGTYWIAFIGDRTLPLLGFNLGGVPMLFILQTALYLLLPFYIHRIGKSV